MGMFDYLKCEYPLEGVPNPETYSFQTKDLDCYMGYYRITSAGRLEERKVVRYEDQSDKNSIDPFVQVIWWMTPIYGEWADLNHHGYLNFYCEVGNFLAKFTDGSVVQMQRLGRL